MPTCPVCGGEAAGRLFYDEPDWRVLRCPTCTYAWVVDIRNPAESTAFNWSEDVVSESQKRTAMYEDRLARAERYHPTPRTWLDVGCGGGGMLTCVAAAGYAAEGIELSPSADVIQSRFGIPVHQRALPDARSQLQQETYGVISYFHVLEHVLDPRAELNAARESLSATGVLIVEVPFFDSLPWKIMGTHHRHFYRGHRSYFNQRSLPRLLESTGFEVLEAHSIPYLMTLGWLLMRLGAAGAGGWLPRAWSHHALRINTGEYLFTMAKRR